MQLCVPGLLTLAQLHKQKKKRKTCHARSKHEALCACPASPLAQPYKKKKTDMTNQKHEALFACPAAPPAPNWKRKRNRKNKRSW